MPGRREKKNNNEFIKMKKNRRERKIKENNWFGNWIGRSPPWLSDSSLGVRSLGYCLVTQADARESPLWDRRSVRVLRESDPANPWIISFWGEPICNECLCVSTWKDKKNWRKELNEALKWVNYFFVSWWLKLGMKMEKKQKE